MSMGYILVKPMHPSFTVYRAGAASRDESLAGKKETHTNHSSLISVFLLSLLSQNEEAPEILRLAATQTSCQTAITDNMFPVQE